VAIVVDTQAPSAPAIALNADSGNDTDWLTNDGRIHRNAFGSLLDRGCIDQASQVVQPFVAQSQAGQRPDIHEVSRQKVGQWLWWNVHRFNATCTVFALNRWLMQFSNHSLFRKETTVIILNNYCYFAI